MAKRLKVLLSAYACEPGRGSEPEVGWRWATSLAKLHDVTVITRANNQPALERALGLLPGPRPRFLYFDLGPRWLKLKKRGLPVWIYYFLWQVSVRWRFGKTLTDYDLVHHLTFNSFRQPGFWWFCPRPVVLGPLGGGQVCPWRMFSLMKGRRLAEFIRSLSVLASPLLPNLLLSFHAAARILVANGDTEKRILRCYRHKVSRLLETGIAVHPEPQSSEPRSTGEVRFMWLSRLDPIKAPELPLRALGQALRTNPNLRLTMVGSGPLGDHVRGLAAELGIEAAVTWIPQVPHADVLPLLARHDAFMFTSLRDTSGNVLLEAMAAGLPAVTLRHQGAAEIATDATAVRVLPGTLEETVAGLAAGMLKLAEDPELRRRLGKAARERIATVYEWDKKAVQMSTIYAGLVRH